MHNRSSTHIANVFIDHWIVLFRISAYLLMGTRLQLAGKFFTLVCRSVGVKDLTAMVRSPQTNRNPVRFVQATVTYLRDYVAAHQQD